MKQYRKVNICKLLLKEKAIEKKERVKVNQPTNIFPIRKKVAGC